MRRKLIWGTLATILVIPFVGYFLLTSKNLPLRLQWSIDSFVEPIVAGNPVLYDYWSKATGRMIYSDGIMKFPKLLAPDALSKAAEATFSESQLKMHKDHIARLRLNISADGKVTSAEISSPHDAVIDQAGLKLARNLRFSPAIHEGGRPMAWSDSFTIDFEHHKK